MKGTIGFVAFVIIVVAALYFASGKKYPPIPGDAIHLGMKAGDNAPCLECHGPGRNAALRETHPPKSECFKCHLDKQQGN